MGSNPFEGTKFGGLDNNPYICNMKKYLKYLPYKISACACVSVVPMLISLAGASVAVSYTLSFLVFEIFCIEYYNRNKSTDMSD